MYYNLSRKKHRCQHRARKNLCYHLKHREIITTSYKNNNKTERTERPTRWLGRGRHWAACERAEPAQQCPTLTCWWGNSSQPRQSHSVCAQAGAVHDHVRPTAHRQLNYYNCNNDYW